MVYTNCNTKTAGSALYMVDSSREQRDGVRFSPSAITRRKAKERAKGRRKRETDEEGDWKRKEKRNMRTQIRRN